MKSPALFTYSVTLLALAACDTTYKVPEQPVGAIGKAALTVFDGNGRLKDPFDDADGDGISNKDELEGWVITVDRDGYQAFASADGRFEENLEKRTVSSDPRWADTDGDGLSDGEERNFKCDPRRADTDGDTVFDADEVRRFATSPSSVDTDGDARGGDATKPPLFQLFDGGELRLMPNPLNPTERIPGPGATSPFLADTDGDGVGDYEESLASLRSPTVANIPKLRVFPTPGAVLDMYFNVTTADGKKSSDRYGTTTVIEEAGSIRNRSSVGVAWEQSTYGALHASVEGSGGCCANLASGSLEGGQSIDHTQSLTQTLSTEFGTSFSASANNIRDTVRAGEASHELTITGGTLRVSLDVDNDGPVTVRVANLVVGVSRLDRKTGKIAPVAELTPKGGDFTLAPRERRTVFLENGDIPVQPISDLFGDPSSLYFLPSRYDLRNQDGEDFDFTLEDVRNQTAAIEVDDGLAADKYWVAANVDPERGTTIGQALAELGIDFEAEPVNVDGSPGNDAYRVRIGLRDTEFWTGAAPSLGDPLPYTNSGGPGARIVKRGWFGVVKRFDEENDPGTYYDNLFDAPLFPGDAVTLIFSEDLDRDGLSAAEERMLGSSDTSASSDATLEEPNGDGLSDFFEAREGWTVTVSGRAPYRVYSSPASLDTDGDGLDDRREASETKTDPRAADTDDDGRTDLFEVEDATYGLDPLEQQLELPTPTASCTIRTVYDDPNADFYYVLTAGGSDAEGDLVGVTIHFLDLEAEFPDSPGAPTGSFETKRIFDYCVDPARFEVTATDSLGLEGRVTCKWFQEVQGNIIEVSSCRDEPFLDGGEWKAYKYQ